MFSENVSNLFEWRNILNDELFTKNVIPYKVKIHLNVFGPSMEHGIRSQVSYIFIITPK